ncbi:hypothetical protein [Fructilactobacillus sanfranciscensis]|uniref:hypothetical protein n=1 Tax=Fructilactobacillus sanfranciscensis TaxID=1625 RepID=UPI0013D74326|nr:hypothetical protein [Fructilactobacillus sanfranciscensis]MDN4462411.1 hypothetical protein [Fructilactobacillus sanfranciscensis]NDR61395.1 hypothetical protein [Fructilactobacillus sanfranciscensis]
MEVKQPLQVVLSDEDAKSLNNQFLKLLNGVVDKVERDASFNSPWIRGKANCMKYLSGISTSKFNELGIPSHDLNGVKCYNKDEVNQYIKENY